MNYPNAGLLPTNSSEEPYKLSSGLSGDWDSLVADSQTRYDVANHMLQQSQLNERISIARTRGNVIADYLRKESETNSSKEYMDKTSINGAQDGPNIGPEPGEWLEQRTSK